MRLSTRTADRERRCCGGDICHRVALRFTIVELLVVTAIISILASLLLPAFQHARDRSWQASCTMNLHSMGLAITAYGDDWEVFPIGTPISDALRSGGYIDSFLHCPFDSSPGRDTYSTGYLGGHPLTISSADPLDVCGWHQSMGTLAAFADGRAEFLNADTGGTEPVMMTVLGGSTVEPGYQILTSDPLMVLSADGNYATLTGLGGEVLLSAAYDPFANNGSGQFIFALGCDTTELQFLPGVTESTAASRIYVRFEYTTAKVDLPVGASAGFTWIQDFPNSSPPTNYIGTGNCSAILFSHLLVGAQLGETDPSLIQPAIERADVVRFFP